MDVMLLVCCPHCGLDWVPAPDWKACPDCGLLRPIIEAYGRDVLRQAEELR